MNLRHLCLLVSASALIVAPACTSNAQSLPAENEFPLGHRCHDDAGDLVCRTLTKIKEPSWSAPQDLIIVAHRGYWGLRNVAGDDMSDVPENSMPGYARAARRYDMVAVDAALTRDGVVMSHDYVLPRVTSAPPTDTRLTSGMTTQEFRSLRLRNRFGKVADDQALSWQDAMTVLGAFPAVVIFVDIKAETPAAWVECLNRILSLTPLEQRHRLVVKTAYTPRFIKDNLTPENRERFSTILFMPQVPSTYDPEPPGMGGVAVRSPADFVDAWRIGGSVAAYETNFKACDHRYPHRCDPLLHAFSREGVRYTTIVDYIGKETSLRGGMFAEEPDGKRGVADSLARWTVKDTDDDRRGDFVVPAVAVRSGGHIVVTTDRPDVWENVKKLPFWEPDAVAVQAEPVGPSPGTSLRGAWSFAGGYSLTSDQTPRLHGLSDLKVWPDGRLLAVGDQGDLLEAQLTFDAGGFLTGVANTTMKPLIGEDGQPLTPKGSREADAEGVAELPNGDRLISFEGRDRIQLYVRGEPRPRAAPMPTIQISVNKGMEALATYPEGGTGAYLVGIEGTGEVFLCQLAGTCTGRGSVELEGMELTALAPLPNGRMAYLLRGYDKLSGSNRVIIKVMGADWQEVDRLEIAQPLTVDNFEGLAAVARPGGVRFYILSDDNFNAFTTPQQTLLFALDWTPPT